MVQTGGLTSADAPLAPHDSPPALVSHAACSTWSGAWIRRSAKCSTPPEARAKYYEMLARLTPKHSGRGRSPVSVARRGSSPWQGSGRAGSASEEALRGEPRRHPASEAPLVSGRRRGIRSAVARCARSSSRLSDRSRPAVPGALGHRVGRTRPAGASLRPGVGGACLRPFRCRSESASLPCPRGRAHGSSMAEATDCEMETRKQ